jgi:hypothetical protein
VQDGTPNRIRLNPLTAMTLTGEAKPINITTSPPAPLEVKPTVSRLIFPITSTDQGVQGRPGPPGPPGPRGPQGEPTKWFHGAADPVNVPGAISGSVYLNTTSGDLFELS